MQFDYAITKKDSKRVLLNFKNVKIEFYNEGNLGNRLWNGYKHELVELSFILEHLNKDSIFFDIGAGIGYFSIIIAKHFPNCHVHAFEPCSSTFEILKKNIVLNQLSNIQANRIALGESEGKGVLKLHEQDGLNTLGKPFSKESKLIGAEFVSIISLDQYVEHHEIDQINLIKMDIEGAELLVLRGSKCVLQRKEKPFIVFENVPYRTASFGHKPKDIEKSFIKYEYQIFSLGSETFFAEVISNGEFN